MKLFAPQIHERDEKTLTPVVKHSVCLHRIAPFLDIASYRPLGRALHLITDPPWQLLIARDGPARTPIEEALYGIGRDHVFYTGERDAKELVTYYNASDLFVSPAYNEAYGMALLEAVATSPIIIVSNWCRKNLIVADGKTGVLISPWEEINFAEALHKLSTDDACRHAMGEAAVARASTLHGTAAATTNPEKAIEVAQKINKGAVP